jgi:hypothetical protein
MERHQQISSAELIAIEDMRRYLVAIPLGIIRQGTPCVNLSTIELRENTAARSAPSTVWGLIT